MAPRKYQPSDHAIEKLSEMAALIRAGRIRNGLTLSDLADQVGVTRKTLQGLESASPGVAWGLVADVCLLLGLPLDPALLQKEEQKELLGLLETRQRVREKQ